MVQDNINEKNIQQVIKIIPKSEIMMGIGLDRDIKSNSYHYLTRMEGVTNKDNSKLYKFQKTRNFF